MVRLYVVGRFTFILVLSPMTGFLIKTYFDVPCVEYVVKEGTRICHAVCAWVAPRL